MKFRTSSRCDRFDEVASGILRDCDATSARRVLQSILDVFQNCIGGFIPGDGDGSFQLCRNLVIREERPDCFPESNDRQVINQTCRIPCQSANRTAQVARRPSASGVPYAEHGRATGRRQRDSSDASVPVPVSGRVPERSGSLDQRLSPKKARCSESRNASQHGWTTSSANSRPHLKLCSTRITASRLLTRPTARIVTDRRRQQLVHQRIVQPALERSLQRR